MIKPASLREALITANPYLRKKADSLHIFIDKGTVSATAGGVPALSYSYTCTIIITDHAGHPDSIFAPLLAWCVEHQPDLLINQASPAFEFEVDPLGDDTYDIEIRVALTERVRFTLQDNGKLLAEHLPAPGYDQFPNGFNWQLFIRDAEVIWPPASSGDIEVP